MSHIGVCVSRSLGAAPGSRVRSSAAAWSLWRRGRRFCRTNLVLWRISTCRTRANWRASWTRRRPTHTHCRKRYEHWRSTRSRLLIGPREAEVRTGFYSMRTRSLSSLTSVSATRGRRRRSWTSTRSWSSAGAAWSCCRTRPPPWVHSHISSLTPQSPTTKDFSSVLLFPVLRHSFTLNCWFLQLYPTFTSLAHRCPLTDLLVRTAHY